MQVVDYGCAECKLLRLFKKEEYVEELVGVDLDPVPLRMNSSIVKPLITDYLHPRPRPLHMALMQGNYSRAVKFKIQAQTLYYSSTSSKLIFLLGNIRAVKFEIQKQGDLLVESHFDVASYILYWKNLLLRH